jgi:carboxylate-amine ligase
VTQALLGENSWRAARYGTAAELLELGGAHPSTLPVADATRALLRRLMPLAEQLGDAATLAEVEQLLERGCAAHRIRERAARLAGDLRRLTLWLADETVLGLGLDRRSEQRMAETTGS